jgi:hypothetical protein
MGIARIVECTLVTTGTPTVLVATTGKFEPDDEGATVSGTGIPSATTILTVTDSTHATMSAAATIAGTAVPVTIP